MRRGEVWWAELDGDSGYRPVVIVSRDEGLQQRRNVTIAEVTRTIRMLPCEVALGISEGMPTACVINSDNLHTIPKDRLRRAITLLGEQKQNELRQALCYSLSLD